MTIGDSTRSPSATEQQRYAFDNALAVQSDRLRALEGSLDEGTIRLLEYLGVAPGWHCAEIAAGGGSIAGWLCRQVGPTGRVVATDLNPRYLRARREPNLTILEHDITIDDLPEGTFDLVHARLLLAWLPNPHAALQRIVGSLRPGGIFASEEMDFISVAPDPRLDPDQQMVFERVIAAHLAVLIEANGFDPAYGRRLSGALTEAGLTNLDTEGRAAMWGGADAGGALFRLTLEQLREPMIAARRVTADEIDRALDLLADPSFTFLSQLTIAAWGRRPAV
ncbi:MAG TPA: methyltransferase domain-containing protein [Chloroflexota bacterium]|nr:methyltransferase domain-containing protein [Chloroflexota bacterium]